MEHGSLPSRERGLKSFNLGHKPNPPSIVAPLAGAWIEIKDKDNIEGGKQSRSPRGSVD